MNQDGTDRKKVIELPDKYTQTVMPVNAFLIGDKLYMETRHAVDIKFDEEYNKRNTSVYSINLASGKQKELLNGKSATIDNVILRGKYIFYQNRQDGEIIKYDPQSGEKTAVTKNMKTYIKFPDISCINNKLFYIVDNNTADAYAAKPKQNLFCYVDINTYKNTTVDFKITSNTDATYGLSGFTQETSDSFIIPTKCVATDDSIENTEFGIISKNGFWSNNFKNIKPITITQ